MIYAIIVLALVAIWIIGTYNFFASSKARIKAAIQEIGNQLKRQIELIPNLESSVKGYLKHEKGVFEMLTEARKQVAGAVKSGNLGKMAEAGQALSQVLPKLTIAVEDNPELKGNEVVKGLMDELRDTSDKVMYARRLLIDLTADFNVKRVSFPSSIVAGMFGFGEMQGLETGEMKTPKVSL